MATITTIESYVKAFFILFKCRKTIENFFVTLATKISRKLCFDNKIIQLTSESKQNEFPENTQKIKTLLKFEKNNQEI